MSGFARLVGSEPPQPGSGRINPVRTREEGQDFSGFLEKADAAGFASGGPALQAAPQPDLSKILPRPVLSAVGDAPSADPIAELAQAAVQAPPPIPTTSITLPAERKSGEQGTDAGPAKPKSSADGDDALANETVDTTEDDPSTPPKKAGTSCPAAPDDLASLPSLPSSGIPVPAALAASVSVQPAISAPPPKIQKTTAFPASSSTSSDPGPAATAPGAAIGLAVVNVPQPLQVPGPAQPAPDTSQSAQSACLAPSVVSAPARVSPQSPGVQPQSQLPNAGPASLAQQTTFGQVKGAPQPNPPSDNTGPASVVKPAALDAVSSVQDSPVPKSESPAQQIVAALNQLGLSVTDEAPSTGAARPTQAAAGAAPNADSTRPATVRGMTIQLNPEHLGPVSVTLRMKAGVVDIHIAVANPETLQLLDGDRHVLSALVEAAGRRDHTIDLGPAPQPSHKADTSALATPFEGSGAERRDAPSMNSSGRRSAPSGHVPFSPSSTSAIDDSPIASPSRHVGLDGSLYL